MSVRTVVGTGTAGSGDGKALSACIDRPWALALYTDGSLLISDPTRLSRLSPDGTTNACVSAHPCKGQTMSTVERVAVLSLHVDRATQCVYSAEGKCVF